MNNNEKNDNSENKSTGIIFIQFNEKINSRVYYKIKHRDDAIEKVFNLYEDFLLNSINSETDIKNEVKIIEMQELLTFVFSLYDFAYLEYDEESKVYKPYGKDWFSEIIITSLNTKYNK